MKGFFLNQILHQVIQSLTVNQNSLGEMFNLPQQ